MARTQESNIRNILSSLFSERWIEAKSREVGFIRRSRKIDPVAFFWTLVFGFGLGNARTFAALRRCYQAEIGESIVPSSFYDRFTSSLGKLMKAALCHLFETALVELRRRFPNLKERMPFERWSAIFAEFAVSILHSLLENRRRKQRRKSNLLELMFKEAIDPNAARSGGLIGRVENCISMKSYVFSNA